VAGKSRQARLLLIPEEIRQLEGLRDSQTASWRDPDAEAWIMAQHCGNPVREDDTSAPLHAWQQRLTSPDIIKEIDRLLDHHTHPQIASLLNSRGLRSGEGKAFTVKIIARIRNRYGLTSRYDRLRKAGLLTVNEMAVELGITPQSVKIWNRHGLIRGHAYNDKNEYLFSIRGTTRRAKRKA